MKKAFLCVLISLWFGAIGKSQTSQIVQNTKRGQSAFYHID